MPMRMAGFVRVGCPIRRVFAAHENHGRMERKPNASSPILRLWKRCAATTFAPARCSCSARAPAVMIPNSVGQETREKLTGLETRPARLLKSSPMIGSARPGVGRAFRSPRCRARCCRDPRRSPRPLRGAQTRPAGCRGLSRCWKGRLELARGVASASTRSRKAMGEPPAFRSTDKERRVQACEHRGFAY